MIDNLGRTSKPSRTHPLRESTGREFQTLAAVQA